MKHFNFQLKILKYLVFVDIFFFDFRFYANFQQSTELEYLLISEKDTEVVCDDLLVRCWKEYLLLPSLSLANVLLLKR